MTNTKFRKRALLSSVAMLLVALVALGSATFAWFTSATDAHASGMVFKTTTSAGILVQSESGEDAGQGWVRNAYLNCESDGSGGYQTKANDPITLNPASYIQNCAEADGSDPAVSAAVFAATTSNDPNKAVDGDNAITSGAAWSEKVYVKTTDATHNVTITGSVNVKSGLSAANANVANAVKLLIVGNDGKVYYHSGATSTTNLYLTDNDTTKKRSEAISSDNYTRITTGTMSVTTGETDNYVTAYVYLDGEDQYVKTNGVTVAELIDGISIDFTLV